MEGTESTLYYGDNLDVMRRHIKDETVDLVYLDPPFNSNTNYNVLFAEKDGSQAASQIHAFTDTWTWNQESESIFGEIVMAGGKVSDCLQAFRTFLGECDMLAYLVMMAPRLVELQRVMKSTASIYLHCDPTASHYLKMLMDAVFGPENFRNEIIWKRSLPHNDPKRYGSIHDTILFFSKSDSFLFNQLFTGLSESYMASHYNQIDENGRRYQLTSLAASGTGPERTFGDKVLQPPPGNHWRYSQDNIDKLMAEGRIVFTSTGNPRYKRYMDEMKGPALQSVWTDILAINSQAKERLGYPTQKPLALLERIISASSNPGDIVLDPFCGCGTTISSAQALNRPWIGIDITHLAINLIKTRLVDSFGNAVAFRVIGEPVSLPDAERLAESEPFQFQAWALGLVGARVATSARRGADKGIDGKIVFQGDKPGSFETVVLSVKAGHTNVAHVRDLKGVLDREKAAIGVLISMQEPTAPMRTEAVTTGFYESATWGRKYPKVQLFTVAELLAGKKVEMPPIRQVGATFKKAQKVTKPKGEQGNLAM